MTKDEPNILHRESILGPSWVGIFSQNVDFKAAHFETAMGNLIRHPNVNSTVILRADILRENDTTNVNLMDLKFDDVLKVNIDDTEFYTVPLNEKFQHVSKIVRRVVPRNPFKDAIINQTCLVMTSEEENTMLILYIPHFKTADECPYYIPPVAGVGILLQGQELSVHYLPFPGQDIRKLESTDRTIRIALRLLQTAAKHSKGVENGYEKRVNHDLVVPKVDFQEKYIYLKQKYGKWLVDNWQESTDPRKHVFEDIAIAAFLIVLWRKVYQPGEEFEYRDLGCGNGVLCYLLSMEGYKGCGIDARARKSWKIYPSEVQLKEQVIIPSVLLRPHPSVVAKSPEVSDNGQFFKVPIDKDLVAYCSSADLIKSQQVCLAEFPEKTFIIGNHSDELTCWIPLLGYPYMVIPCCSHSLSGARTRYHNGSSTYSALVEHVEFLSSRVGWKTEKEMLRIPSTRNAAVIGYQNATTDGKIPIQQIYDVLHTEGGAEGWVENTMALMKRAPRNH